MDEQTIQQQSTSQEPEPQEIEDSGFDDEGFDGGQEPEVSMGDDGELNFSDDFFGDVKDEPQEPQQQEQPPSYYTEDELRNTPYEQWDFKRLHKEVQPVANILNEQIAARQRAQQIQQREVKPRYMQEPRQYTAQELSTEAQKLAMQKLGLQDEYDVDEFDRNYQSALRLAQDELMQRRNGELAEYNRRAGELQQLQRFNAELSQRPDYKEFSNWYAMKCKEQNVTPEQVNAGLNELIRRNGERYSEVQNFMAAWYREFQTEKAQRKTQRRKAAPPVLESSRGSYDGGRSINMRRFGELDSDAQAKALMDMGIV